MVLSLERSTMLFMGKSTISMAMFHSYVAVYQRVNHRKSMAGWWFFAYPSEKSWSERQLMMMIILKKKSGK